MNRLLLRADCTSQTGTGHVMRCLALAQACLDAGGKPFLLARELPSLLAERLAAEGIEIVDLATGEASETIREAHRLGAKWIVLDGYHFAPQYPGALRQAGFSVLMIDDMGGLHSCEVDAVLNQNFHADVSLYKACATSTRLLLLAPDMSFFGGSSRNQPWRDKRRQLPEGSSCWPAGRSLGLHARSVTSGGRNRERC